MADGRTSGPHLPACLGQLTERAGPCSQVGPGHRTGPPLHGAWCISVAGMHTLRTPAPVLLGAGQSWQTLPAGW